MEAADSVIAVTGAGGFIGHHLFRRLIANGTKARAMVRYRSETPGEHQFDLITHILDPAAMAAPVRALVHCAWDAKPTSMKQSRQINVDGTRWLVDECKKAGVEQFVMVSCLGAYAGASSVAARAKRQIEDELLTRHADFAMVISSGTVIGDGGDFARARSAVKHHSTIPVPISLGQQLATVPIDDLCGAIIAAVTRKTVGKRLFAAGSSGVGFSDFYRGLGLLEHKKPILIPSPDFLKIAGIQSPICADQLMSPSRIAEIDFAQTSNLLGIEPAATYLKSLEQLAAAEGHSETAHSIREFASTRGEA